MFRPGRYDVIYNHILVHKYYLNQDQTGEVSFSNALVSWYNNVYDPIISIIKEDNLVSLFPQRTPGDLYVWIVKHWDILKKKYGIHYSLYDAVHDFRNRFGKRKAATPFALIKSFLSGIFGTRR